MYLEPATERPGLSLTFQLLVTLFHICENEGLGQMMSPLGLSDNLIFK